MTVSVIIVNFNGMSFTRECLTSFRRWHPEEDHEVIVVDNASSDGTVQALRSEFPWVRCIPMEINRGFGAANNVGAAGSKGEFLFFVNNDTVFTQELVTTLVREFKSDVKAGMLAPTLMNADGTVQRSVGEYPTIASERRMRRDAGKSENPEGYDWVTAAAVMVRRSAFEQVHGFDERFFMYFEDVDLCRRIAHAGYSIRRTSAVSLIHLGGKSYGAKDARIAAEYRRSQLRYYDKHNSIVQRTLLRGFLLAKYLPMIITAEDRDLAYRVFPLLMTSQGGR